MKKLLSYLMIATLLACATAPEPVSREERSKPISSALAPAEEVAEDPADTTIEPPAETEPAEELGNATSEPVEADAPEATEPETPVVTEPSPQREEPPVPPPAPEPQPTSELTEAPKPKPEPQPRPAANNAQILQGEFIYVEGEVLVSSKGQSFEAWEGDPLEPYATLETGPDSYAEVEITGPGLGSAIIKFSPNTSFYFEGSYDAESSKTLLQLMSGQARIAVEDLDPNSQLETYTRVSVLGVRGTVYNVIISPGDNVLVTCEEGLVAYEGQDGVSKEVFPGQAVLSNVQEPPQTIPLPVGEIEEYQETWINDVEKTKLIANAPQLARIYRERFLEQKVGFERNYALLERNFRTLEQWDRIIETGGTLSMGQTITERKVIAPILLGLRKSSFFLERDVAQIEVLYRALGETPQANAVLAGGGRVTDYLAEIGGPLLQLKRQLSMVRWANRVFAEIDPGSPLGDFLNTDFSGSEEDFFDDTGDFFE
jgi:hypothetical protein